MMTFNAKNKLLLAGALLVSSPTTVAQVHVGLSDNSMLRWDGDVRLRQVLEQVVSQSDLDDIYWPASRLLDHSGDSELAAQQQHIADELAQLAALWQYRGRSERAEFIQALRAQVLGWQLAYQPLNSFSLEQARQTIAANPLLTQGNYSLELNVRPTTAFVFGATNVQQVPLQTGQTLRGYRQSLKGAGGLSKFANRDKIVRINNGKVESLPIAYYNASADELLPGDMLWIAPQSKLFPERYAHLLADIPALLTHFIGVRENTGWVSANEVVFALPETALKPVPSASNWQRQARRVTRNHHGGTGLMQTPTARMAPEGEGLLMYSDMDEYRRYTASIQVLPWLEATAFYTQIPNRLYSTRPDFSGDNILTDKGFDVKFRVWEESYYLPEVAVGFSDFAGTGLFDGEYIVANKQFGAFDFSLGLGFGRLGSRDTISNPLCEITDRFCSRPSGHSGTGSQLEFDRYFRGPASLFGGVEYQTPWEPLRVKLEYDGNDYSRDRAGVPIDASTPWNIGLNYQVFDWLDAQVSYERGDTLMFNFVLKTNLSTLRQVRVDRPRVNPEVRDHAVEETDWNALSHRLNNAQVIAGPRFQLHDEGETVRVVGHPWRYRDPDEMLDRTTRILADALPPSVKTYEVELQSARMPMVMASVDADAFRRRVNNEELDKDVTDTAELFSRTAPDMEVDEEAWVYNFEDARRVGWGVKPFLTQDLGSPETFHFYQVGVKAFANSWITPNIHGFGEVGVNIKNNYDKFLFDRDPFDLPLPRVRSDFRQHATNDVWLDSLQLTYYKRLSTNSYASVYGGYLERFFSGVGIEYLYREVGSPWAFGFNVNRVKQRDYNGWLGTLDYETTMGHASVMYQMPWLEDTMLRLDVGRFLAGDDGVGITFAKRFESGVVVSAYASFTDVSSEDYGEGSFTHGFTISLPFDLIGVRPTRQRVSQSWSPMSRDGGQPLWRSVDLYGITDDRYPFWNR